MKKIINYFLCVWILLVSLSFVAHAEEILPGYEQADEGRTVLVGLRGSFLTHSEEALTRLNEIRKEACEEGNVPDPRNPSRMLTSADYVPIIWSSDLEKTARIRAAEASITIGHSRLITKGISSIAYNGTTLSAENLAWNPLSDGELYGIEQWYSEKSDWVLYGTSATNQTGHYTSIIDPSYKSVGVACFYTSDTFYNTTVAADFYTRTVNDQTMLPPVSNIIQTLSVDSGRLSYPVSIFDNDDQIIYLDEKQQLLTEVYIQGKFQSPCKGVILPGNTVSYEASDSSVADIDNEYVSGKMIGDVQINVLINGTTVSSTEFPVEHHHNFSVTVDSNGTATGICQGCPVTTTKNVPVSSTIRFENADHGFSGSVSRWGSDSTFECWLISMNGGDRKEQYLTITSSDPSIVSVPKKILAGNIVEFKTGKPGFATVTFSHPFNENLTKTYVVKVGEDGSLSADDFEAVLSQDTYFYVKRALEPKLSVSYKGYALSEYSNEYKVVYEDNINAGTAKVIITGTGIFAGEKILFFKINPLPYAENGSMKINKTSFVYTGEEVLPTVTALYQGSTLVPEQDYTISYENNVNVGTASVSVQGINNYEGVLAKEYQITPRTIMNTDITLSDTSFVYTGKEILPEISVITNGRDLTEGIDYELLYDANITVGSASVTITGINNYTGVVTKTFEIKPADLAEATLMLSETEFVYTGKECTPDLSLTFEDITLEENMDYSAVYSDNVNAGTVLITLQGTGNFCGIVETSFTIHKVKLEESHIYLSEDTVTYRQKEIIPDVTLIYQDEKLNPEYYSVVFENNLYPGTALVTVTGFGNYEGEQKTSFTIINASIPFNAPSNTSIETSNGHKTLQSALKEVPLPDHWKWQFAADDNTDIKSGASTSIVAEYIGADAYCYDSVTVCYTITRAICLAEDKIYYDKAAGEYEADCFSDGYGHLECRYCQDNLGTITIPALGHSYQNKSVPATCKEQGYVCKECRRCGDICDIEITEDITDHTWDTGKITLKPTDKNTGIRTYTCTFCEETRTEDVPALLVTIGNVTYRTGDKQTATYVNTKSKSTSITIPATVTINSVVYKVTAIEAGAFKGSTTLKKVVIGKYVLTIGKEAFANCKKLATVTLGSKVESIGTKAFANCIVLTNITIPASVKKINESAFYGCKKLKTITIKTTALTSKTVGKNAFKGLYSKATIKVPSKKLSAYKTLLKSRGVTAKTQKILK